MKNYTNFLVHIIFMSSVWDVQLVFMVYTRLPPNFGTHLKYSLETKREEEEEEK